MTSILMVLTGANVWTMKNGTPHPTGFWSEEFVAPHKSFTGAGLDVSVATPQGRAPAVDPLSLDLRFNTDQAEVDSQKAYLGSQKPHLDKPLALGEVNPADYDVMFVVGGHGPMQDLAVDPDVGGLIGAFLGNPDKILAAVCHGPASFLSAHDADGDWLFKGTQAHRIQERGGKPVGLRRERAVAARGPPPPCRGPVPGRSAVDSCRGNRRKPRDRPAELFRPGNRRRRHRGARSEGLSYEGQGRARRARPGRGDERPTGRRRRKQTGPTTTHPGGSVRPPLLKARHRRASEPGTVRGVEWRQGPAKAPMT
jgi:putative intracellular protease/amidase